MLQAQLAIAYLYYRERTKNIVEIDFIEVNRQYKRKGVATRLMEHAFQYFEGKGYKVVNIHCVTQAGYRHARKLGFKKYVQENHIHDYSYEIDCRMFRCLLPTQRLRKYRASKKLKFVVWSYDPSGRGTPNYYYDLSKAAPLPLVDYLYYDWYVGIMKGDEVLKQDKAKRFFKEDYHDIYCDCAVYLSSDDMLETIKK